MRYVALLRGINVTGKNKVPMADLRELAERLRFEDVSTYIQSGNLLFDSKLKATELQKSLEAGVQERFGLTIPVIVRSRVQWTKYAKGSPYPDAEDTRANTLLLALCQQKVRPGAAEELRERSTMGERVSQFENGLWIDYAGGSGKSKLTPSVLDRVCGAPVTTRNFRTVCAVAQLL